MDVLAEYATQFNSDIKKLTRTYVAKMKGGFDEADACRSQKRVNIAIAADPFLMIKEVGPHILRKGKEIQKRDWDAFMAIDFKSELKNTGVDDGNVDEALALIGTVKKVFTASTDTEKTVIGDTLTRLLSVYCQYALQIKKM
jgi:hypothetical protein